MNLDDGFRDLAPLDPGRDPERWERMVAGITAAAAPELARRARLPAPGMLMLLGGWVRPTLSAAAVMAAAAGAFLFTGAADTEASTSATLADALGTPSTVASWVETGTAPTMEDMVLSLEGASR